MKELKARPIRRHSMPAYPTKLEVLANPDLLRTHLPPAWLTHAEIVGAAGVFLAANLTGCSDSPEARHARLDKRLAKAAIVAPVFEHGEGRGATGCVVTSPPVFLSEEEAIQVIREEMERSGLEPTERNREVDAVTIPHRLETPAVEWITGRLGAELIEVPGKGKPLKISLEDPKHKVAVVFVSETKYDELGGGSSGSTVQDYDLKEVAQYVARNVKKTGKGMLFGAFYDPAVEEKSRSLFNWKKAEKETRAESQRLLRLQVKDFVDWLKGQGVI